jgi:hypothetical protein
VRSWPALPELASLPHKLAIGPKHSKPEAASALMPLGVHHDVARGMMPEPGCWMPLVVVHGTLWRFGESAAASDVRRPASAIAAARGSS